MGATHSHERLHRADRQDRPGHQNRQEPQQPRDGAHSDSDAEPASRPVTGEHDAPIANRYRLLARMHAGSAGILYRAEDLAFSREVALRLLTPALSRDEAVLARLQQRLAASTAMAREDLGASGDIVDVLDLGRAHGDLVFVVTEFVAGESLAAQLAREGPLRWPALRPLMVRACQILHLSHQHGLLRLDLQTRHLFPVRDKTSQSTLKILSPGIGDVFGDSLWASLDPSAAAAHLRYAAPEQLTGGTLDARTDIYALGVIMFELLCGRVPFPDTRPAYVCARHLLEAPPPFPANIRTRLPEAVVGIVTRALAKQPEDRWPTMRALANAMAAIDFGPCDASGVLEVVDVEVPNPTTSSTSMRIDPAAGHAPSPAVRPRTMPPLRDAFLANSEAGVAAIRPVSATAATGKWFTMPENIPSSGTSSSSLAWDEILAAAEEAVAAVAASASTGTAGDSDVCMPERLLHTGEAATASTIEGRLAAAVLAVVTPPPGAAQPRDAHPAPPASSGALRAGDTTDELGAADSVASLRAPADRSASVWPLEAKREAAAPRRSFVWAAAAVLAFGATAGGVRLLRPAPAVAPVAATPEAVVHRAIDRGSLPASIAPDMSSRTGQSERSYTTAEAPGSAATPTMVPMNLSPGPAAMPPAGASATQWSVPGPAETPVVDAPATTAPELAPEASPPAPLRRTPPAPEVPHARAPRTSTGAPPTETTPSPARKSAPGTRLPDAGIEPLPVSYDPLQAAALLERAQQAAARGDRAAAMRLAIESYHAQPNTNALKLVGELACKLHDPGKATWARRHLPAAERPAMEATCKASGVAYE